MHTTYQLSFLISGCLNTLLSQFLSEMYFLFVEKGAVM